MDARYLQYFLAIAFQTEHQVDPYQDLDKSGYHRQYDMPVANSSHLHNMDLMLEHSLDAHLRKVLDNSAVWVPPVCAGKLNGLVDHAQPLRFANVHIDLQGLNE
jgi:hypothetical protein